MREEWLYYLMSSGRLTDNQEYYAINGCFTSRSPTISYSLKQRQGKEWTRPHNNEKRIWNFLQRCIKYPGTFKKDSVIIFDVKNYEHNTDDQLIFLTGLDARNFTLRTGNLIGYVRQGDYSLKISSRFGDAFLKHIISDADGFLKVEDAGGTQEEDRGYEWLLYYLWKVKLQKAFRLGVPKQYVSKNDRLVKVRGQVDPVSFLIDNKIGKYQCQYREHSYNNQATQLIATAFKHLASYSFLDDLHPIRNAFVAASLGKSTPIISLYDTPHFSNPFYAAYNQVIDLSKSLLKNDFKNFGDQKDNDAFLFDVSMLFEYYIRKLLQRAGFQLVGKFDTPLKIPRGLPGQSLRKLEPDLLWETEKSAYVFDVKYKSFDSRQGVNREDLFQLYTYASQYGNEYNIRGFGLIYPLPVKHSFSREEVIEQSVRLMGKQISFFVIFLVIPEFVSNEGERLFHENMRKSATRMIQNLKRITHV